MKKILSIHLTDRCDNHCRFCVVGVPDLQKDSVNRARIDQLLLTQADQGFEAVNLHGGEPTLQEGFLDTLSYIRDLGYPKVILQTNGYRLRNRAFVRQLVALNVTRMVISLHGADAASHDCVTRKPGSFNAVLQAIRHCKEAGARVHTNTVLFKDNIATMSAIADLALSLDVDHINISNLHPAMTAFKHFEELAPTVEQSRFWVRQSVDAIRAKGGDVTLEGFPYCLTPGMETYHLRRDAVMSMEIRDNWLPDYERFMNQACRLKGEICQHCLFDSLCGGVYREYIQKRGWDEFSPILSSPPPYVEMTQRRE